MITSRIKTSADFAFERGKTAILCFHGFSSNASGMKWMAAHLAKYGYSTEGRTLPGHTHFYEDIESITIGDYKHFALDWFREIEKSYSEIFLLGHSLGALLAIELATQVRVSGVIALSAPFIHRDIISEDSKYIPVQKYINDEIAIGASLEKGWPVSAFIEIMKLRDELKRKLSSFSTPLLALYGAKDALTPVDNIDFLEKAIKEVSIEKNILETSGHILPLSKEKKQIVDMIHDFIKSKGNENI